MYFQSKFKKMNFRLNAVKTIAWRNKNVDRIVCLKN